MRKSIILFITPPWLDFILQSNMYILYWLSELFKFKVFGPFSYIFYVYKTKRRYQQGSSKKVESSLELHFSFGPEKSYYN